MSELTSNSGGWSIITEFLGAIDAIKDFVDEVLGMIRTIIKIFADFFAFFKPSVMNAKLNGPVVRLIGTPTNYQDALAYKVCTAIIPIAAIFIIVYLMMQITDLALSDQLDMEIFLKTILFTLIGFMLMDNLYPLMLKGYEGICGLNNSISSEVASMLSPVNLDSFLTVLESLNPFKDGFDFEDIFQSYINIINIVAFIVALPFLAIAATVTLDWVVGIRAVKIAITMAFIPVAVAGMYANDGQSIMTTKAVTHIKKIISLFVQGPLILIMTHIVISALYDAGAGYFGPILLMVLMIPLMFKSLKQSEETAEEIMDV